jgi:glycerophosphoryl diester phosphodiesterase
VTSPLLDPAARLVIGHRGACAHAPENTLRSFDLAVANGVDALELDVHLSADGRVVVIHDGTLDRTTDARGAVASLPFDRIRTADAGARFTRDGMVFPFRSREVRVPAMEEVLERYPETPLLIEVKTAAAAGPLRRVLERFGAAPRCVIGAFDRAALDPFRAPPWHICASQAEVQRFLVSVLLPVPLRRAGYEVLSIPPSWNGIPFPLEAIARTARRHGMAVHIWTVDDPLKARSLWRRGLNGVITNDPESILAARTMAR